MLFNSFEFLLFLPIVFLLYWFVFKRLKWQNLFLVVASYVFYGWWDWRFLILIALTTLFSYVSGRLIARYEGQQKRQKALSAINIVLNLSILGVFKYYNFFAENFAALFGNIGWQIDWVTLDILLPVGISFYTFQALSYSIDVYQKKLPVCKDIIAFFAYISFFPQLVAGPIERATNLLPQFYKSHTFNYAQAVDGCRQILWGFFKKMVVADNCATAVNLIWGNYTDQSGFTLLMGGFLFTLQIYGDFSGYSDIAIGTARLFGINLMRNFSFPYFSRDIAEFWRRWHISLTTWFRDYIYIPLGGSRCARWKVMRNTLIIFLVSGLWHGANWNFVLWGVYYGVLLMIEKLFLLKWLDKLPNWIGHIYSMFLVVIGWTIFAQTDIHQLGEYLKTMFGIGHVAVADSDFLYFLGSNAVLLVALIAASIDYRVWMRRLKQGKDATIYDAIATSKGWTIAKPVLMVVFLLVSFAFLVGDSYNPFLYFRF